MKLVIAGTRTFRLIDSAVHALIRASDLRDVKIDQVITGGAEGVDEAGKAYATSQKIPHEEITAKWLDFGRAAGPIRNAKMADVGDHLLLIWNGKSKGSADIKKQFEKRKKPITEYIL